MTADRSYSNDECAILEHFFTNTDRDVYFLRNFPDFEVAALFVASYSRNKKTLRDMFLDTILDLDVIPAYNEGQPKEQQITSTRKFREAQPQLVLDCFAKWASTIKRAGDETRQLTNLLSSRARLLFGIWADKYGHDSLKDMAHGLGFACERVSIVLSKIIEDHPLTDAQEKSTRYLGVDESAVFLPKEFELAGPEWIQKINQNTKLVMSAYKYILSKVSSYLLETRKKPEGVEDSAWKSAVMAEALDNARYLLPARLTTNLGQICNARTLQAELMDMLASPLI
ncbi:MAG: FAD-dependent thymidylate synthase, partial [DPANN group archaeon]|nr:FAD-dependent thymidylate synthase [DPANN group archaeon]